MRDVRKSTLDARIAHFLKLADHSVVHIAHTTVSQITA
jgi:hypothetical protein